MENGTYEESFMCFVSLPNGQEHLLKVELFNPHDECAHEHNDHNSSIKLRHQWATKYTEKCVEEKMTRLRNARGAKLSLLMSNTKLMF